MITKITILLVLLASTWLAAVRVEAEEGKIEIDEIPVQFSTPKVGGIILPALLGDDVIYLPVVDIFNFLRINMDVASDGLSIDGFFLTEEERYRIDASTRTIVKGERTYRLEPEEMISTDDRLYLRSDLFGRIFRLDCVFDFRALAVKMMTTLELPAVRDMIRERIRANLRKLSDSVYFDKAIGRNRTMLRPGALDWSVGSLIVPGGEMTQNYSLRFGGELAYGDLQATLMSDSRRAIGLKDISGQWRYVATEIPMLRQTTIGSMGAPLPLPYSQASIGVQLTNAPPTFRKAFGAYVIEEQTEPGWTVELLVNGQLVDFVKVDESGRFRFEAPLSYGTTAVTLKFYGPWGEERTLERSLRVPFTFLPVGDVEYDLSGGVLQNGLGTMFSRARAALGISTDLTLAIGASYIDRSLRPLIAPFISASVRVLDEVLVAGEYTHGMESRATASYTSPSRVSFELRWEQVTGNHSRAHEEHTRELGLNFSLPLDLPLLRGGFQLGMRHVTAGGVRAFRGEADLATSVLGIPTTISTVADVVGDTLLRSLRTSVRCSYALQLFSGFTALRPGFDFDHLNHRVTAVRVELERTIFNGLRLGASFGQDLVTGRATAQIGLRFETPFGRAAVAYHDAGEKAAASLNANGSISYDSENRYIIASNRGVVGRGGITIRPFLDMNNNGLMDDGERRLTGLDVAMNGGVVQRSFGDSLLRVVDVEPYRSYIVTVTPSGFENIAWKPRYSTYRVEVVPNHYTEISVPVIAGGEITGKVVRRKGGTEKGMVGVNVQFKSIDGSFEETTVTSEGGAFYHLGLPPGRYVATVAADQLTLLSASAREIPFEVRSIEEGDIVDGLDLVIE